MARDINDIERELARTRTQLASTLDELADRANPSALADNAKGQAKNLLQDETVQKVIGGIAVGVAALLSIKFFNSRKRKNELKELQRLLASR
ncbi:DUF3618 domain-containing protein [Corynebacterium riegelii]|uniref:DUF3618 domain-containing protein n=1 Tax=Corynebacterium riegelii TaxID=156976 RepID=UPI00254D929B|nr:DUF3618 domain-containing protein [Corynebacterium riegelii]